MPKRPRKSLVTRNPAYKRYQGQQYAVVASDTSTDGRITMTFYAHKRFTIARRRNREDIHPTDFIELNLTNMRRLYELATLPEIVQLVGW